MRKTALSTLLLLPLFCLAQQLHFVQLTTKDGLPSNDVYTLHQDQKGYIWACTNYGIVKYTGTAFRPVCTNLPFNEQFAYCMYEDKQGRMGFATSTAHVYTIRNDSACILPGTETMAADMKRAGSEAMFVFTGDDGGIYVTTKASSYCLLNGQCINLGKQYAADNVGFVLIKQEDQLFVIKSLQAQSSYSNTTSCLISENGNKKRYTLQFPVPVYQGFRYAKEMGGCIYLSSHNMLIRARGNVTLQVRPFEQQIISLNSDRHGHLWVGCYNGGLYELDADANIIAHYFPGCSVNAVLFDDQQGMWVSTSGHGLFHCTAINDLYYTNFPGLSGAITMVKATDSTLFIGTSGGQLYALNEKALHRCDLPGQPYDINDICAWADNYVISSKSQTYIIDKNLKHARLLYNNGLVVPAIGLLPAAGRGIYFISPVTTGKMENGKFTLLRSPGATNCCMAYLSKTRLLTGTHDGLYVLNLPDNRLERITQTKGMRINALKKNEQGGISVCTRGYGLYNIDTMERITEMADIPGRIINDICYTASGTVICTNKGVFVKKKGGNGWSQLYSEESNQVAAYGGRLFVGSAYGLIAFDPSVPDAIKPPVLQLASIKAGDSIYRCNGETLSFGNRQNDLEFNFDLPDFRSAARTLYYTLKGPVNRQTQIEGTTLHLNSLPPGRYIVSVSAYSGEKESKTIEISFFIHPAFWQTGWFICLAVLLFLALICCILLLIRLRIKKREQRKAALTRLVAEHKLTAIKAQINPHFISNALASIQQLIVTSEFDKAGLYLARFSMLIRNVLRHSDAPAVTLSEELSMIGLNIELEQLRFYEAFAFRTVIGEGIDPDTLFVPPLITQPITENAIWHGLLPLKGRVPVLTFSVSRESDVLVICIEDNGVGRRKDTVIKKESKGMALTRSRLENINLLHNIHSAKMEVEDLQDASGQPAGTRITLNIPYLLSDEDANT